MDIDIAWLIASSFNEKACSFYAKNGMEVHGEYRIPRIDDSIESDLNMREEYIRMHEDKIIAAWNADLYDQNVTETDDVDFLLNIVEPPTKRILEVCCGSGRILVPLAKAGHTVFGLDADTFMLAKILAKAEGLNNIQWRHTDAVHGDWGTGFDVVVLAGNILYNIVTDMDYAKAQELFIQKAASALVSGGYVFINYSPGGHCLTTPGPSEKDTGDSWVIWEDNDTGGNYGRMILLDGAYDADTQISTFTRRFEITMKDGKLIKRDIPSHKHFATLEQLHQWLENAGFSIEQEYANLQKTPIDGKSTQAIIYARKG